jgi:hypothetical protein
MATTPTTASTVTSTIVTILGSLNGYASLGLQVGGLVIPLIKGLIKEIKTISAGNVTVTYQVLIETDGAELAGILKLSLDDLASWNAELIRLKQAPVPGPAPIKPAGV